MNINFKAKYVSSSQVPRIHQPENPASVHVVELLPADKNDCKAMDVASTSWQYKSLNFNYARDIYYYARCSLYGTGPFRDAKFYGITTQSDNYANIDPTRILGLAMLTKTEDSHHLNYIQIDPDEVRGCRYANFQRLGTAFLEGIKNLPFIKKLELYPIANLRETFYAKNGFKSELNSRKMVWKKML